MDPNTTDKTEPVRLLTESQVAAVAHIDKEIDRYMRMAKRLKEIGMPLLAKEYERSSKALKGTLELQIRVIRYPQKVLTNWK